MNITCIRAGVKDLSSGALVAKAAFIEDRMRNNPHFPDPTPTLDTLSLARQALGEAAAKAFGGGHAAIALRWILHAELERHMVQLSKYVVFKAHGDLAAQITSGFEPRTPPNRIMHLPPPASIQPMRSDYVGNILLKWGAVHGARTYQVEVNALGADNEDAWTLSVSTTRRRTEVSGLVPGKFYWLRVRAIGAAGVGGTSMVVSAMAH